MTITKPMTKQCGAKINGTKLASLGGLDHENN